MSSSSTDTNEKTQTQIDPALKKMYMDNYTKAQNVGADYAQQDAYMGQRVADPTWAVNRASEIGGNMANQLNGRFDPGATLSRAEGWLNTAANYKPQQVGAYGYDPSQFQMPGATVDAAQQKLYNMDRNQLQWAQDLSVPRENVQNVNPAIANFDRSLIRDVNKDIPNFDRSLIRDVNNPNIDRGSVRDISADQILPGMAQYQNRYSQDVIDQSTQDLNRAREIAQMQAGSDAVRTGSFGGGRHGVVESETNRGFADATARMSAEERRNAFNVAGQLSGQDVQNKMAAAQANQGADTTMAGLRQAGLLSAGQANQQADMNAMNLRTNAGIQVGQANQAADQNAMQLRTNAGLQIGQANQGADLAMAQMISGNRMQQQAMNQNQEYQTALANMNAMMQGGAANTDRQQQANMANAGYGQQSGLANQQAMLDASKYNAGAKTQADMANQSAGFQNISQLLAAAGQLPGIANQQYQMPMDAMSKMLGLDQYSRGVSQEQINALMQQYNERRQNQLLPLQLQSAALGINLPNLGMTSTGQSSTSYNPSGLQTIGQIAGIAGSLAGGFGK